MAYKCYIVFEGYKEGLMTNYEVQVIPSIKGYPSAKFKGFNSETEALQAYRMGWKSYYMELEKRNQEQISDNIEFPAIW